MSKLRLAVIRKVYPYVIEAVKGLDIVIDDGGHKMRQQIVSYEELFGHIKHDGVYLCEDTHTSYWLQYGGGYKRQNTFIEYSKNFIDYLKQKSLELSRLFCFVI